MLTLTILVPVSLLCATWFILNETNSSVKWCATGRGLWRIFMCE